MVLGHCAVAVASWPRLPVSSSRSRLQSTSPSSGLWQKLERREESEKKWLETLNMVCREILRIKTLAGTWRENGKSALHQNLLTWNRCYHILDQWATTVKLIWKYNKKSFHNVQKKKNRSAIHWHWNFLRFGLLTASQIKSMARCLLASGENCSCAHALNCQWL